MFEPHTDIVRKGGRETAYGHKINLATGRGGLVLDVVVETGNPADSARCLPMLERHCEHYGKAPTHAVFDSGYASKKNLEQAKALGVEHAVFSKRRGLKTTDMTPSSWVNDHHKRFRAGVEAGISFLKRCFRLARCRWRGLLPGMGTFVGLHAQPGTTGATAPHLIGGKDGKRANPVRAMTPEGLPWL